MKQFYIPLWNSSLEEAAAQINIFIKNTFEQLTLKDSYKKQNQISFSIFIVGEYINEKFVAYDPIPICNIRADFKHYQGHFMEIAYVDNNTNLAFADCIDIDGLDNFIADFSNEVCEIYAKTKREKQS